MISILPKHVVDSIKLLEANGYDAYVVGGAVRDYYSDKLQLILILQPLRH